MENSDQSQPEPIQFDGREFKNFDMLTKETSSDRENLPNNPVLLVNESLNGRTSINKIISLLHNLFTMLPTWILEILYHVISFVDEFLSDASSTYAQYGDVISNLIDKLDDLL